MNYRIYTELLIHRGYYTRLKDVGKRAYLYTCCKINPSLHHVYGCQSTMSRR